MIQDIAFVTPLVVRAGGERDEMGVTHPLLLMFLLLTSAVQASTTTTTTAVVVEAGQSALFKHEVEVEVGGKATYSARALVEVSRYSSDTLVVLPYRDESYPHDNSLVSEDGSRHAVVVNTLGGRVSSLVHHIDEDMASLNYKRSLTSLLTPAHHTSQFAYHTQVDVLGSCEVQYERKGSVLTTWRDLTRCSHFTSELFLGSHNLPLLHLYLEMMKSWSQCKYRWRDGTAGGTLDDVKCVEVLQTAPRYTDDMQVLNITVTSTLSHATSIPYNPRTYEHLQSATESTDLMYQQVLPRIDNGVNILELLQDVCTGPEDGRLTGTLLQKLSDLGHALALSDAHVPGSLPFPCHKSVRRMLGVVVAVVGGPRALHFFVSQLAELSREDEDSLKFTDNFLLTFALKNLVYSDRSTQILLPEDFFFRRENEMVYEELVDHLLSQTPSAVAGVVTLLQGLSEASPELFDRLLQKSAPYLSPAEACEQGNHTEAVRLLRGVSGLSARPRGYVASLRPCFATDDVGVAVAAMDTLLTVNCDIQGVTELQKLGFESPSDPEIRIAAYRGLVHCIPHKPDLLQTVIDVLDPAHDDYSTQVASYVWSHMQSVMTSSDPSLLPLRGLLAGANLITEMPDPVWYDPRQHSRHLSHTVHLDAKSVVTVTADLVWGRYSPAPRALYLTVALHHDGFTYKPVQVVLRATGMEAMLFSIPGMESIVQGIYYTVADIWVSLSHLAQNVVRSKRDVTHDEIADFISQVISRIPADNVAVSSSVEVSLSLLGTHAFHMSFSDLHNTSTIDYLSRLLQVPLQEVMLLVMPIVDKTLTLTTLSGMPVALGIGGVVGIHTWMAHDKDSAENRVKFFVSGGMMVKTRVEVGQDQSPVLTSKHQWVLDLPLNAHYYYQDEGMQMRVYFPNDWQGQLWQQQRDTSLGSHTVPLKVSRECLGLGEPLEFCWQNWMKEVTDDGKKSVGWLNPHSRSFTVQMATPDEPIIITLTLPSLPGGVSVMRAVVEMGGQRFEGSVMLHLQPSPSLAFTLNSPDHTYFLKGFAGSREGITQMAELEFGKDGSHYGLRIQLSTPQLGSRLVWSPSVFIITPEEGEIEILRIFFSFEEETRGFSSEFTCSTLGSLADHLDIQFSGDISSKEKMDGSLELLEIRKLNFVCPGWVDLEASGRVFLGHTPQGKGFIQIGWGQNSGQVALGISVSPVVTFLTGPSGIPIEEGSGSGGISLTVSASVAYNDMQDAVEATFALRRDRSRVDVSLSAGLMDIGGFNISHTFNGPLDFKSAVSVSYMPLEIVWGAEHEMMVKTDEFMHSLNVSWSHDPIDRVSSFVYFARSAEEDLDISFYALLIYLGQLIEIEESLRESRGGSYKNKLKVKLDPGKTIIMDTVIISRTDVNIVSYGLSNTFKLDTWVSPLSVVGTLNCYGVGQCSVAMTAEQAGDQLADLEVQHTAAGDVSRTDANIIVTNWFDGTVSFDTAHKLSYYSLKWTMLVRPLKRVMQGRAEINLASNDVLITEMVAQEWQENEELSGAITHFYNGTVNLNKETRSVSIRQEVRLGGESREPPWAVVVQGRLGEQFLNSQHFAKVAVMMPTETYYTAAADMSSQVQWFESVEGGFSISANIGPNISYLLAWDINLQNSPAGPQSTDFPSMTDISSVELWERPLLTLETLLRCNTPTTGEVKLNIRAKDTQHPPADTEYYMEHSNRKMDVDVRLITEAAPELGRIHGSLTRSVGTYSLNGKMWSGSHSFAVIAYGVSRNESIKGSHSFVLVDPTTSWKRLELLAEAEHIGDFPHNFQISASGKLNVGFEEAAAVTGSVQWTPPSAAAVNLAFATYLDALPGGNIFFKWVVGSLQSHVSWANMKAVAALLWSRGGRAFEFVFNLDNPGTSILQRVDTSLTFDLSEPPYSPVKLLVASRVSLNSIYHFILNIDSDSQKEQYTVNGALVRPGGSGSLRIHLRRHRNTYVAVGALVIDEFSGQLTGAYTYLETGEEIMLTLQSSLLANAEGYAMKFHRKDIPNNKEITFVFAQGGDSPQWVYSYRILAEIERDIKVRLRKLRIEDHFTYEQHHQVIKSYNFFILVIQNKFDQIEIELEFPDVWAQVKVSGTVVKGKDSQLDLIISMPSIKHVIEGRLIFGSDSWTSSHSGTLTYTQHGKKGRGRTFRVELDASRWNSNRQKYKFYFQKMLSESPSVRGQEEFYSLTDFSHDDPNQLVSFITLDSSLDVAHDPGSTEYKMAWQTDGTKNEARLLFERDLHGGGGLFKYHHSVLGRPKSEMEYLVKSKYRHVDTEFTFSCTLHQTSVERPRAINFLHSEAEGYTELVLDLFEEEGDQVILVITYLPHSFRFRIGQFGNTFLQMGYQQETDEEGILVHSIQLESSGHTVELWAGMPVEDESKCRKGGLVLQTPELAPTHQTVIFCPAPTLTVQLLGIEEREGPYLRVGQISGPGGVGIQIGGGRLQPLDTPPALTFTADIEEDELEVLFDWQSTSLTQLKAEFVSRGSSVFEAVAGLGSNNMRVEGQLGLWVVAEDTYTLLKEAMELTANVFHQTLMTVLRDDLKINIGGLVQISGRRLKTYLVEMVEASLQGLNEMLELTEDHLHSIQEVTEDLVREIIEEVTYGIDEAEDMMTEVVDEVIHVIENSVKPPLLRIQATITALTYKDDQSLYNLVSRIMGELRSRVGRRAGLPGFIITQTLTKLERWMMTSARWEDLRTQGSYFLKHLRKFTTLSLVMPHDTALRLRVSTPVKLSKELTAAGKWFQKEEGPRLASEVTHWLDSKWSRVRYLLAWHVYGEAVVMGWEQAISWDGRYVSPLLTDSCHHLLVLLTHSDTPTAVTIHMQDLETRPHKVLTFFSGTDRVTIDSDLKMTYNTQQVRRPLLKIGELSLRSSRGLASVASSAGITLECELDHDICRLKVDGDHFAATAGLLGIFDFDSGTDLMTSGWEIPATEEEWAQSWRVTSSKHCSSALPDSSESSPPNLCHQLYESPNSTFRSCFASVPPSPYLEACQMGPLCDAEAAYLHACRRHYISMSFNSSECLSCPMDGEEETDVADFRREIVIITDFDCLEDMQDLVTALRKDEESEHYIVLRYIGRGTPRYGPFNGVTEIVVDAGTLPLEAVTNAAELDFSERALKAVILFDCDHPRCSVSNKSPEVENLREMLLTRGIQLHVITKDAIAILNHGQLTNKVRKQIIGLDVRTAYTMSHARKRSVRGKPSIREHISSPIGNTCTALAIESDGSVFSLHQVKIQRKYHRKIFQQLLAQRVEAGWEAEYLQCWRCNCKTPCTLCDAQRPFIFSKSATREDDDDDDYDDDDDDDEVEERPRKRKRKKGQRSRENRERD